MNTESTETVERATLQAVISWLRERSNATSVACITAAYAAKALADAADALEEATVMRPLGRAVLSFPKEKSE